MAAGNGSYTKPRPQVYSINEDEENYQRVLQEYFAKMCASQHQIGYPLNYDFDYTALERLMRFHLNNIGDPFCNGHLRMATAQFEIGVLDWFAELWELKNDEYWGYVTTGGTEGNMHGILIGRELHPDGILYASENAHYSIMKIARLLRIQVAKVKALPCGEIDCDDLRKQLIKNKGKHAILNVTLGTTFKGAIDDLDKVVSTLDNVGYDETEFYIHCDGALCGIMLPFIDNAKVDVSFAKYPIGSISVSGHKFMGCPIPCGVQITRKENMRAFSGQRENGNNVEYLGSRDVTICGSRSGHTPIFMWYCLNKKGKKELRLEANKCLENAKYLKKRLECEGVEARANESSCSVVFERPKDEDFIVKWQLSCEGELAQVVVMQHVTLPRLDCFAKDLAECLRKTAAENGIME